MIYLKKNYEEFLKQELNEVTHVTPIDYEKISCLRQKMNALKKRLSNEHDSSAKRKLQIQIKICELKIMVAQIK